MSKKIGTRILSLLICMVTVLSFCGIASFADNTDGAKLSKTSIKMVLKTSYTLKVSGYSGTVKWSSSDKDIVTVTSKGKVKAAGIGTATVKAVAGDTTLKCKVTVIAGSIKFDKSTYTIPAGEAAVITATVKGDNGVSCVVSNTNVAKLESMIRNGNKLNITLNAKKAGTVKLKVFMLKDKSISKTVTVKFSSATEISDIEDDSDISDMSYAEQILYYVNIEREKEGLSPLKLDDKLCRAADIRAKEITESFSHTRPDGEEWSSVFAEVGFKGTGGENIAAGYDTAEATVAQWMASDGHRANILNKNYTVLGAGAEYDKNSVYRWYWVQLFS